MYTQTQASVGGLGARIMQHLEPCDTVQPDSTGPFTHRLLYGQGAWDYQDGHFPEALHRISMDFILDYLGLKRSFYFLELIHYLLF